MHEKHIYVTHAYYFISESIIIYLALLPIVFSQFVYVSVWAYLGLVLGISIVYAFIAKQTANYFPYIISIPFLVFFLQFLGFSLGLSIVFASLFAWRFISIRGKMAASYEPTYIGATILLTLLGLLIMRDFVVIVFLITQAVVVLFGYTLRNLLNTEPEKRRAFNRTEWLKWGGFFGTTTFLIYLFSDTLAMVTSKIWTGIGGVLTLFAGGIAKLFEYLGISDFFNKGINQMEPLESTGMANNETIETTSREHSDGVDVNILIYIFLGILLLVFIVILYKTFREKASEAVSNDSLHYDIREEKLTNDDQSDRRWFKKRNRRPNHPIRKLVYEFEKKAAKLELGRLRHESIENWFDRLDIEGDIQVYQKVRYGDYEATTEEENNLRDWLKEMEARLEKS
jgi:hypothetical protein